ncbi:hypothetical protein BJX65DRAFT_134343 [Aspergillus insuetus]
MVISNSERSEGRMGKHNGLEGLTIYAHLDIDPVLVLYGHGEDFQGILWKVPGGAAAIAFASPRAALLIPVPEPPPSLEPEAHLKSILDSIVTPFLRDYQPDYWPVRGPEFHVVVSSRSRYLSRDVYWPMLKQLLQSYNLPANETLTLQDFKTPNVPDDSDIDFIIHEKRGHSHVTLLDETDGPPPWFYIGVDDLEDRSVRLGDLPAGHRSSIFRILRDEPPPKLPAPIPKQTLASKGKGKAKLVQPEDLLIDWCKTFSAGAKGESPPRSFSKMCGRPSDEIPMPENPFHWRASKSSAPVSRNTSVSKGKGKGKAKQVHRQPPKHTQAVPQETWPPDDNDKDEETQRLDAWQDWWQETGHELPEGGSAKFHCRPSTLGSPLSFYEKLSTSRVHGEGVQGATSSAEPQVSSGVDKGKGKGKEAQRLPPAQPTPLVSQEAWAAQGRDQSLPPLGTLGLLTDDSRPRPVTIGQPTWEDNGQGFPRVPPPVTLLPPVLVDNSRDRLYGPTPGLPTLDDNGRQQPATMLPPLLGDNAQGLTLASHGLPTSAGNSQGLPNPTSLGLPIPTDKGEGVQGGSSSVTPQTPTSEDKDKGGQRESSSATSHTSNSSVKGKGDPFAPN